MSLESILIAETNPYILDTFTRVLADSLPHVRIDLCDSPASFPDTLQKTSYDTIAMSPLLISDYHLIRQKKPVQLLTPLLMIAGTERPCTAQGVIETDAFDVIVTPIHSTEAVETVRLALWQNRLLRLLASKDRSAIPFEEHMAAFPDDWKTEEHFVRHLDVLERTIDALHSRMRQLMNGDDEQLLFDIAASVMQCARQRALDRLFNLSMNGTAQ